VNQSNPIGYILRTDSEPQLPHVQNEDNHDAYVIEWLGALQELIETKCLDEFMVPHKDYISFLVIIP
jgi:hypothetical protein